MLLGVPLLVPILAMAGLPFLQRMFLDRHLSDAKSKALPEISANLRQSMDAFGASVLNAVRAEIHNTLTAAESSFDAHIASARAQTERERSERRSEQRQLGRRTAELEDARSQARAARASLDELLNVISNSQETANV